jgi:hypothetical protein
MVHVLARIDGVRKESDGRLYYGWTRVLLTPLGQYVEPVELRMRVSVKAGEIGSSFEYNNAEVLKGSIQVLEKLGSETADPLKAGFGFNASPLTWTAEQFQKWQRACQAKKGSSE